MSSRKTAVRNRTSAGGHRGGNEGGIPLNILPGLAARRQNMVRRITLELGRHIEMRRTGKRTSNVDRARRCISGIALEFAPASAFGPDFAEQRSGRRWSQFAVLSQAKVRLPLNHPVDEVLINHRWQSTDTDDIPDQFDDGDAVGDCSQNLVV